MTQALATTTPATGLRLRAGQASRAGRKPENEDALGIRLPASARDRHKGAALALADGVSGAGQGRQAAEACVQGFLDDYYSTPDTWSVRTSGERVLAALNRWLHGQGQQYTQVHQGFLATVSAVVLRAHAVHVFHVGDSRVWRLRRGILLALTRDHATRTAAGKRYLTRAMGMAHDVEIDYLVDDAEPGDLFLLTTDGVHDFLPPARLAELLAGVADEPQAGCERLLDAALAAGSNDNLSCQMLVVEALDPPEADDSRRRAAALPLLPDLAPGQRLDGLVVEEELHATARSQVYRVRDEASGRQLALKTPSRLCEGDAAALAHFALEDWLGQHFAHPNLIRGMTPLRERSGLYLLQELLDGETLAAWRERNPRPPVQDVVAFAAQAVKALQALHRREVLHQDIKPDNLFLCRDGSLKVIDLGAAHASGLGEADTADCPGAVEYAAPECRLQLPRDERADQFSLAATLYELLTGKLPFGEGWLQAHSVFDFQRLRYRSACHAHPHVPLWLDAALCKALASDPAARYDSLSEFLADLQRPNPDLAPVSARPWLQRDPAGFWRALALALGVVALVEFLLLASPWRL